MKKIFLLSAVLFALQSFSQQPYYDFEEFRDNMNRGKFKQFDPGKQNQILSGDSLTTILKNLLQEHYTPVFGDMAFSFPRPGVYILPQDNMPCMVPDLSQFNMPVLGRGIKITGMPPGSQPPIPLIPPQNK